MKRTFTLLMSAAAFALCGHAQLWQPSVNVSAEARVDFDQAWLDDKVDDDHSGFKGKFLNLKVSGEINKHLSYSWRQRFIKHIGTGNLFDATDWIYLCYHPDDCWDFSAGKQVVGIGGYEYDRAPIDIYTASEYWNNIPCYQLGASVSYRLPSKKDKLMLQVTANPFRVQCGNNNTYAYNLMWSGSHGIWSTLWSVNAIEYTKGHFISYIALGNRFAIDGFDLELDFMNRANSHQAFWFKDCSVMAELGYSIQKFRVFFKTTYDVNHSGNDADWCVYDGTELWNFGGGLEFFPLRNSRHDLRLHANYFYTHGKNGNPDGALRDKTSLLNVGLTWKFNIFSR